MDDRDSILEDELYRSRFSLVRGPRFNLVQFDVAVSLSGGFKWRGKKEGTNETVRAIRTCLHFYTSSLLFSSQGYLSHFTIVFMMQTTSLIM